MKSIGDEQERNCVMIEKLEQKQQIVRCIRMLERSDIIDYNGHASVRIGEQRMLINIGSCQRSQLTVDDICTIDFDGNLIEGNGKPPLEFHLCLFQLKSLLMRAKSIRIGFLIFVVAVLPGLGLYREVK